MKTIYLHIGTHKTGSTAVQAFAKRHSKELERLGLLYPVTGQPRIRRRSAGGHHLLPWTQLEHVNWERAWGDLAGDPRQVWNGLRNEIESSGCDTVLISSEEFDVLDDEGVSAVASELSGFNVEVVCYLRRLDDFVQSYYTTDVLYHGETRTITEFIEDPRTTLDYFELIGRWRRHFGERHVQACFYHRGSLVDGDIVADVFGKTGIDVSSIGRSKRSRFIDWGVLSPALIETVRKLNVRGIPPALIRPAVYGARMISSLGGRRRSSLLNETETRQLVDYGIERMRLLESDAFTAEVEAAFSRLD